MGDVKYVSSMITENDRIKEFLFSHKTKIDPAGLPDNVIIHHLQGWEQPRTWNYFHLQKTYLEVQ